MRGRSWSGVEGPALRSGAPAWLLRAARPEEAAHLTGLALRSKAVWGYAAGFMERCRPLLTVTSADIAEYDVVVGERGGRIAGFYSLRRRGEQIELDLLFIEPDSIGLGLGTRLFAHAAARARQLGFAEMVIESDPGAEGFYLRVGARRIGTVASTVEEGRTLPLLALDLEAWSAPDA